MMTKNPSLKRKVGVALWRQIADAIRNDGLTLADPATGKLPSEAMLANTFEVNRHTIRSALSALSREGFVETRHGSGTFLRTTSRLTYPISRKTRFSEGLGEQVGQRQLRLLEESLENAKQDQAHHLALDVGASVLKLDTIGLADGVAISRGTSWFPADRFAHIGDHVARTGSITAALNVLGVSDYMRKQTGISARFANDEEMRDLNLHTDSIVLVLTSVNVDENGTPIQYGIARFPASRVELMTSTES